MVRLPQRLVEVSREQIGSLLTDMCIIRQRVRLDDEDGGWSWQSVDEASPCRVAPVGGMERGSGGRVVAESDVVFTLPWNTVVTPTDVIVYQARAYSVVDVQLRTDMLVKRVFARETT